MSRRIVRGKGRLVAPSCFQTGDLVGELYYTGGRSPFWTVHWFAEGEPVNGFDVYVWKDPFPPVLFGHAEPADLEFSFTYGDASAFHIRVDALDSCGEVTTSLTIDVPAA